MSPSPSPSPATPTDTVRTESGVTLRNGKLLSIAAMDRMARQNDATLVVLVGPPDSGKTTLISTLYELVRAAKVSGLWFAGSRSLIAFEECSHLSRVDSDLEEATMERTKYSEEQNFYHFRMRSEEPPHPLTELFLLDVAGEGFRELHTTHDACRRLDTLGRADFLAVLLDGKRLNENKTRQLAIEECINFLQCAKGSGMVNGDCEVQVIVSKVDKVPANLAKKLLPEIETQIRGRLGDLYPKLAFAIIAARPDNASPLEDAHGVPALLQNWAAPRRGLVMPRVEPDMLSVKREAEAFGRRQSPSST